MSKLYPDISHYHPVNNWESFAEAVGFAISKATQGTAYIDSTLGSFIAGCEKKHIPYWLYTYLNKGNELAQTKFLVSVCKNRVGEYFQGYVLDIEAGNPESNCINALKWLKTQCERTMIYTGWADRSKYKNLIENRGDTLWWEARYGKNDGKYSDSFPCHKGVDIHQYTSNGICPGVTGRADLSRLMKDIPVTDEKPAEPVKGIAYTGIYPVFATGRDCYKQGDGYITLRNYPTQIKRVQKLLKWITGKKLTIDGKYGPKTEEVCREAQHIIGANPDGIFGTQTLRMSKAYRK